MGEAGWGGGCGWVLGVERSGCRVDWDPEWWADGGAVRVSPEIRLVLCHLEQLLYMTLWTSQIRNTTQMYIIMSCHTQHTYGQGNTRNNIYC